MDSQLESAKKEYPTTGIVTISESLIFPNTDIKRKPEPEVIPDTVADKVWGFRTPTLMQHIAMPFYDVPRDFKGPLLDDPKLSQLK